MTTEKKKIIHIIYGVFLSIITVAAAGCFIGACYGIFKSGSFSREKVAESFSFIAVPVYLCLATVIGGFILEFFLPSEKNSEKSSMKEETTLALLKSRLDTEKCEDELLKSIKRLEITGKVFKFVSLIVLAVCSVIFLIYACNPANFHQSDINSSMISAVIRLAVCLASPFIIAVFTAYYSKITINKEINLLKQAIAAGAGKKPDTAKKTCDKKTVFVIKTVVVCILVIAGVVLLVYGAASGGTADVLTKAKNICTECIGLG